VPAESPQIVQQLRAIGVAQVIVVMKRPVVSATGRTPAARLAKHFVTSERSADAAIHSALMTRAGPRDASIVRPRHRRRLPPPPRVRIYRNLGVMLGTVRPEGLHALRRDGDVAAVTGAPHFTLIKPRVTSDATPTTSIGWGIEALEVPTLWKAGLTGNGVVVAHLDTGADGRHPALRGAFASFAEFDALGAEVTPAPKPHDTGEHGTHTAATIAGRAVRGFSMGIAPGAQLASAIVIEGGNVVARVLAGLDWALSHQAKVLSMSLGLPGWWDDFVPIIRILRARGVLPVIAVGNEGPGTSRSPGNYSEALSVGAVTTSLAVADFSSSQQFDRTADPIVPDLVAPGVDIISAVPGNRYKRMSGTSMATPHVAGLAALLFGAKPGATIDEVERAILTSCARPAGMTAERGGHGVPNAPRALAALMGPTVALRRRAATGTVRARQRRASGVSASRRRVARRARRERVSRAGTRRER
jgi:subtilisin family serine protease